MDKDLEVFEAMQLGRPLKTYKKQINGKLVVKALNPFDDTPMEVVLEGDPKANDKGCFISLWTSKQVAYFERMNDKFISEHKLTESPPWSKGMLTDFSGYTEEDIVNLFDRPYMWFKHFVEKISSIDFLTKMLEVAEQNKIERESYLKIVYGRLETLRSVVTHDDIDESYTTVSSSSNKSSNKRRNHRKKNNVEEDKE